VQSSDKLGIDEIEKVSSTPKRAFNIKLIVKIIISILFISTLYSLFFGDSSIGVLQNAQERDLKLKSEYTKIQNENQKLQKKHFELIQLTPEEDSF